MDELTLARREFEFEQKELTFTLTKEQFDFTKQQFYSEQKQLTQQVQLDKQQFDIAKQQFYSKQEQLAQQFEVTKQQFELEKITFQHELQQQRDLISKQQLAIDQQQFELSKQQALIGQQKQHLQQHLQSYIIPSSNNNDLIIPLSESVQNEEQSQQLLSQHLITSPPSPSLVTNLLEGMINKSNNHLNHEIEHYYQLTKQLHGVVNHLKRKEKKIKRRDIKSKQCFRGNYHIRHHLVCYLKFMKSRHDMIISIMKWNTKLKEDNKSLKKTTDKTMELKTKLKKDNDTLKRTVEELNVRLDKDNTKFKLHTTPLYEKQMIVNKDTWELRSKQNELKYLNAMKKYKEKKVGKEPEMGKVEVDVMIKLINLNKNMHFVYPHTYSNRPLLSYLYHCPKSNLLPIFGHFFKKNYDNGTIPKLSDDLKLFFSTQHIDNGRWIQFHGPDKEVDGSTWDNPINVFSLLNPNNVGTFKSTQDSDRCGLSKDECKKQHKETDHNYESYHSSPLGIYTARYQISIKWEYTQHSPFYFDWKKFLAYVSAPNTNQS